jgi:hypothetical protein
MPRKYREDMFKMASPMGWLNADGELVDDTADRFSTPFAVLDFLASEESYKLHHETIGECGLQYYSLEEIITLGFTTREYQAMVLYSALSNGQDQIRSERELTALMSSKFTGHVLDRCRAGSVADARRTTGGDGLPAEPSGRIRRPEMRLEKIMPDDQSRGRGRFELEHWFRNDDGTDSGRGLTLAKTGIMDWKLSDAAWWGFTACEYDTLLLFEFASNGKDHVRSEDELNILYPGWAHEIDRTLQLYNFRKAQEFEGALDHRHLHPDTLPDPEEEAWRYRL